MERIQLVKKYLSEVLLLKLVLINMVLNVERHEDFGNIKVGLMKQTLWLVSVVF